VSKRVYVGNLPWGMEDKDVAGLFEEIEIPPSVHRVMDRESGRFKGFAFVEFSTEDAAEQAIKEFDEATVTFGNRPERVIKVSVATERQNHRDLKVLKKSQS